MSGQTSPLAFPAWRQYWAPLDGLLAEADAVLGKRAAGNQRFPYWNPRESTKAVELAMNKLRAWAGGRPPPDISTHPEIIRRIHATVHPALKAAAWPRWLLLERAFLDGSATGDLAFTALTLRSMCEEVQRLHALDLDADQLAVLAASRSDADMKRLELFLSFAQASLGTIPRGMVLHGRGWPSLKLIWKAMPQANAKPTGSHR